MPALKPKKSYRRIITIVASVFVLLIIAFIVLVNVYVEPALRKKLHTLIIDGSDSLYTYKLGSLHADFFGGKIEVNDLEIEIDSTRFLQLKDQGRLSPLVMQLSLKKARILGIGVLPLLFNKTIRIEEVSSDQADVRLSRYPRIKDTAVIKEKLPLWRAVQSKIKDVSVNKIKLNGIKLLYKDAEGQEAVKLQFDRCDALFENIRIDSVALADTSRIGYVENFSLKLHDLKFRSPDSLYKLKAEWITYNSRQRLLSIDSFKLQPTLKNDERIDSLRKSWYTITFDKMNFNGLRLDRYLRLNRAEADSVEMKNAKLQVYQDKKGNKVIKNNIGSYPHQKLLKAGIVIAIKKFIVSNMQIEVTEKNAETRKEGSILMQDFTFQISNIVNDPIQVKINPVIKANARGKIIGSTIDAAFTFYLDSANGRYDLQGHVGPVTAAQLNPVTTTLANVAIPSASIAGIDFFIRGEDFGAVADVQMQYNSLAIEFRKRDEETGANSTRGFLTKWLNKFVIYPANPYQGTERKAEGIKVARLTTQPFFSIIWKAFFAGIQQLILKSGQV